MSGEVREVSAVYRLDPQVDECPEGYKRTEVGMIPEEWDVLPLVDVAKVRSGIAKNTNKHVSKPIRVHYIRVANVQDGYLDLSEMSMISVGQEAIARYALLPGDVLMNEGGDLDKLGRGAIWRGEYNPCIHQNHVFVVRCGLKISFDYLNVWTCSEPARHYFLVAGKQTTNLASINKTALGQLPVALPSVKEQTAIANALSDVDALITSLESLITKKRAIKTAAMQQLLTGKKRLPGFKGEWHSISMNKNAVLKARIGWQALTTNEYLDQGHYHLVTGTDFKGGKVNWSTCHYVDEWRYRQDRNIQLKNGDVLLTKDGTIGKVGYVDKLDIPGTLNSGVFVIRPVNDSFHPLFLFDILSSRIFDDFLNRITAGSTITHLYQKDFVMFEFLAPSLQEQKMISESLSCMDDEIELLENRLNKTQQLKLGMMQELLTGRTRLL